MDNKITLAQDRFIEGVGNICNKFGLNQFLVQLFIVLYLNKKSLSLDELAGILKASKGNVSINIRELERWGAVRKIWVKGSRRDYYEAEGELSKVFLERLRSSIQKRIGEVSVMLREFEQSISFLDGGLTEEEKRAVKVYRERLRKIAELKDLVSRILGLAEKMHFLVPAK
jgi:DNA-binding transcriptional regulator GbsR (MarR family)